MQLGRGAARNKGQAVAGSKVTQGKRLADATPLEAPVMKTSLDMMNLTPAEGGKSNGAALDRTQATLYQRRGRTDACGIRTPLTRPLRTAIWSRLL